MRVPASEIDEKPLGPWQILVLGWQRSFELHGDSPETLAQAPNDPELSRVLLRAIEMAQIRSLSGVMTMLSDIAISAALNHEDADQRLVVCPLLDAEQIGSASIDLRLGTEFMEVQRTKQGVLDPFAAHDEHRFTVPFGNELIIHPGQFLLGSTLEYLRVPRKLAGQVLNRSSWARNGLLVATAVSVHPGFTGVLTLELVNSGTVPLTLVTGSRICQFVLWELDQETSQPYPDSAKYDAPLGPQPSRLDREAEEQARIKAVGRKLRGLVPEEGEASAHSE